MSDWLALLDWRGRVGDLYRGVRARRDGDPEGAHALWRETRDELFARHPQSPVSDRAAFTGLRYFPYDPSVAFAVPVEPVPEHRLEVTSSTGQRMPMVRIGIVRLPLGALEVHWIDVYGGGLFVAFRDATAGSETYGGGRYLLDTVKGADLGRGPGNELILDFNFAYHPSCAYDPRWSCPLAPPANHLPVRIEAGERS